MHFAIWKLFYEEIRKMFLVPRKSSQNREIRKIEVRLYLIQQNEALELDEALKTIPPTPAAAERAFSAAALLLTKLRSRLSDKSIDCLCFLKSYFKNE
ncbi:hypothetical protein AVEN_185285-1 [Araneus ventricosus]|uniref:HAT C-terminal dimerisation domain-containing protein n=1 Tax=Araneus ventricosus TaxID=182803 RepID=A0A4Y2KUU8_ARAVE|nr:hypothetical protein AVEN_185285-1 [Araneus ventricosus]